MQEYRLTRAKASAPLDTGIHAHLQFIEGLLLFMKVITILNMLGFIDLELRSVLAQKKGKKL